MSTIRTEAMLRFAMPWVFEEWDKLSNGVMLLRDQVGATMNLSTQQATDVLDLFNREVAQRNFPSLLEYRADAIVKWICE